MGNRKRPGKREREEKKRQGSGDNRPLTMRDPNRCRENNFK